MLKQSIKIGDRMRIQLKRDELSSKAHVSQIENILSDNRIVAHAPISYGQVLKLPTESEYKMLFFTERGIIRFDGVIEGYAEEDGFNVMIIELTTDGERIQRRDFFRFACVLPMKFSVVEYGETEEEENKKETHQGIVKDIGGGGIRFISNASVEENTVLKCVIKLNEHYLVAVGEVLQKYHFPKSSYRYQYRVGFTRILPTEQEKIVQFIFHEQKKALQKMRD